MLKAELCTSTYAYEISVADALKLVDDHSGKLHKHLLLIDCVTEAEWDGHFGPNIFVTVDCNADPSALEYIGTFIQQYLDTL